LENLLKDVFTLTEVSKLNILMMEYHLLNSNKRRIIIWWLSNVQVGSFNLCDYALVTNENLKKVWCEVIVMVQNRAERVAMKKVLQI